MKCHFKCLIFFSSSLLRSELFSPYEETVNLMYRENIHTANIRSDFFSFFSNLQYIKLQSCENLKELPEGISKCLRLEMVSVKNCAVEVLPADLFEVPCLKRLHCVDLMVSCFAQYFLFILTDK